MAWLENVFKAIFIAGFFVIFLPLFLIFLIIVLWTPYYYYKTFKNLENSNEIIFGELINKNQKEPLIRYKDQDSNTHNFEFIYKLSSTYNDKLMSTAFSPSGKLECGLLIKPTRRTKFLLPFLTRHYVNEIKNPVEKAPRNETYEAYSSFIVYDSDKNINIAENFCNKSNQIAAYNVDINKLANQKISTEYKDNLWGHYSIYVNPQQQTLKIRVVRRKGN